MRRIEPVSVEVGDAVDLVRRLHPRLIASIEIKAGIELRSTENSSRMNSLRIRTKEIHERTGVGIIPCTVPQELLRERVNDETLPYFFGAFGFGKDDLALVSAPCLCCGLLEGCGEYALRFGKGAEKVFRDTYLLIKEDTDQGTIANALLNLNRYGYDFSDSFVK